MAQDATPLTSQLYALCHRLIPGSLAQSLYSSSSNKMESIQFPVLNLVLFKLTQMVSGFCNWNLTNTSVMVHVYADRIAVTLWRITGTLPEIPNLYLWFGGNAFSAEPDLPSSSRFCTSWSFLPQHTRSYLHYHNYYNVFCFRLHVCFPNRLLKGMASLNLYIPYGWLI